MTEGPRVHGTRTRPNWRNTKALKGLGRYTERRYNHDCDNVFDPWEAKQRWYGIVEPLEVLVDSNANFCLKSGTSSGSYSIEVRREHIYQSKA